MSKKLLLSLFLLVVWNGPASAHARLKAARPGAGSTVAASPSAIEIDFSEGVVAGFSSIKLADGAGKIVPLGRLTKGGNAATLVVPIVGTLPPGTYRVTWHAVSVDTHRTQGGFTFTVGR